MDRNTNWTRYLRGDHSVFNQLVKAWKYYGFSPSKKKTYPFDYDYEDYKSTNADKIKVHKTFLEGIQQEEQSRLALIESKSSTLVSQTGIIFSLLSLFIPIIIEQIADFYLVFKILFFIILIGSFLFYIITIRNAMRNSNIKNFHYSKPHPNNVIKYQDKSESEFDAIVVRDLLHGANENKRLNNIKADNLIFSYRAFKLANTLTGTLVIMICVCLLFFPSEDKSIKIENPIIINDLDSLLNNKSSIIKDRNTKENPITQSVIAKDTAKIKRKDSVI